jgi:hypothetical protein
MQTGFNTPIRKVMIRILIAALLVLATLSATPALARNEAAQVNGALPASPLRTDGLLNLTPEFYGALDLNDREVLLDAQRGPLFRPVEGHPSTSAFSSSGEWSALGTGVNGSVLAIAVSGSDIYVGGNFTSAGNCNSSDGCNHIAKWDGSTWSALGTGTDDTVEAIAISGSTIYVGGDFSSAGTCTSINGCNYIAKWEGGTWSALSTGMDWIVKSIAVSGGDVYAGGLFGNAGTCTDGDCNSIAKWNGVTWSPLGMGIWHSSPIESEVDAIAVSGSDVYAAGLFTSAGTCTSGCIDLAKWDGSTWSALGTGLIPYSDYSKVVTIVFSNDTMYVGGGFASAGTCTSGCDDIAKWDGNTWSALGTGPNANGSVTTLAVSGSDLYVGGLFTSLGTCTSECNYIAKWDGNTWSALGTGTNDWPQTIALTDSALYAGGSFTSAGTCTNGCNYIAKYTLPSGTNMIYLPLVIR